MDRPQSSYAAPHVLLATIGGSDAERFGWDVESGLLVAALSRRGVRAEILPWDAPVDWARSPLVVVRTPWDYTERHPEFMAWVDEVAAATTLVNDAARDRLEHAQGLPRRAGAGGGAGGPDVAASARLPPRRPGRRR